MLFFFGIVIGSHCIHNVYFGVYIFAISINFIAYQKGNKKRKREKSNVLRNCNRSTKQPQICYNKLNHQLPFMYTHLVKLVDPMDLLLNLLYLKSLKSI